MADYTITVTVDLAVDMLGAPTADAVVDGAVVDLSAETASILESSNQITADPLDNPIEIEGDLLVAARVAGNVQPVIETEAAFPVDAHVTKTHDLTIVVIDGSSLQRVVNSSTDVTVEHAISYTGSATLAETIDIEPILSAALVTTEVGRQIHREDRYHDTGVRPSFPIRVYHADVRQQADLADVPIDQFFILSQLYNRFDDDPFFFETGGGAPGMIGQRVEVFAEDGVTVLGVTVKFRSPDPQEVVCLIGSLTLLRFDSDGVWRNYLSMPERAIEGNPAFTVLDPDRIYAYYARVLGAMQAQYAYDNSILFTFYDPRTCPEPLLVPLGRQYGLQLSAGESEAQRRAKIELAIPTFKAKGLEESVSRRLSALGYAGGVWEVWIDPTNPETFLTDPNSSQAAYRWRPDLSYSAYPIAGNSGSVITVVGDATSAWDGIQRVLERDVVGGEGPGDGTVYTIVQLGPFSAGFTDITVTPAPPASLTGHTLQPALPSYVARPHGMSHDIPVRYWPSSRLVIHVTYPGGVPIDSVPAEFLVKNPTATIEDFWKFLADQLYGDVIPLHTDVKFFTTSVGAEHVAEADLVDVSDTLAIVDL